MPELPEVETITRQLVPLVEGRSIERADLRLPRLLLGSRPRALRRDLAGGKILRLVRRGKYIVFELQSCALVFHLGMTGQLTFAAAHAPEDPRFWRTLTGLEKPLGAHPVDRHTHFVLHFREGGRLLFRDPRTFGRIIHVPDGRWPSHPRLALLGAEPLSAHAGAILAASYPGQSARPVKALLLDQSFLAGVGNIYADEALFLSGIHPLTPARSLDAGRRTRLLSAVKRVLRKGIRHQGTTFSDYRKPDGTGGSNYEHLKVYGRGGRPCLKCGTRLEKTVVAQRGTVFCPACQPPPQAATRRRAA